MSNATAVVKFKNGFTQYSVYYGSIDMVGRQTYSTKSEAWDNYNNYKSEPKCEHDIKNVELYTDYGGGITWDGKCCSKCGWVTDGVDPYYEEDDDTSVFGNWL